MRFRPQLPKWAPFFALLTLVAVSQAFGQQHNAPIKITGLTDAIRSGGLQPSELADIINKRGVDFRLTYDNEQQLREVNASQDVIDAVRKHFHHAPVSDADKQRAANLLNSSRALLNARNLDNALPVVTEAIDLDPFNADAYALRGQVYVAKGDTNRATAEANIALEIDPRNTVAQQVLRPGPGGTVDPAGAPGNTGTPTNPTAPAQVWFGFRYWKHQNGSLMVTGVLPSGSAARGGLLPGDVLVSVNNLSYADFFQQYVQGKKLAPGVTVSLVVQRQGQQVTLQLTGQTRPNPGDEALRYFGQLIQQFPGNPEAYLYRAAVYTDMKNFQAAMDDINNFIRLNPADPQGFQERAHLKTMLGDQAGAKADQEAARNLNPDAQQAPNNAGTANPGGPAAPPPTNPSVALPEQWTWFGENVPFRLRQVDDYVYLQAVNLAIVIEAKKGTDKKGNVTYKGTWQQTNTNGAKFSWRLELKNVAPNRIDGNVYYNGLIPTKVVFIPSN